MDVHVKKFFIAASLAALAAGCEKPAEATNNQESAAKVQTIETDVKAESQPVVQEKDGVESQAPAAAPKADERSVATTGTPVEQNLDTNQAEATGRQVQPDDHEAVKPDALGVGHSGGANPHIALSPDQHIKVALQHRGEGRVTESLVILDQAIEQFPESAQLYAVRSDIRRDNAKLAGALADIEKAVRLNPQSAPYLVGRSQLYLSFERLKEAEADLTRAIALEPGLIAARFNRGTLYAHNGDYEKALLDLNACIATDPHIAAPYFNRGSVYYNLDRKEEAVKDIERFIELADVKSWKSAGHDLLRAWGEADSDLQAPAVKE